MGINAGTEEVELVSVSATTTSYTPTAPANWVATVPNTVQQALDRLAAAVSANGATPIP